MRENNYFEKRLSRSCKALKAIAFISAMAVVSVGSIGVYRMAEDDSDNNITSTMEQQVSEKEEVTENNNYNNSDDKNTVSVSNANLLSVVENTNNKLSTEEIVKKALPSVVGVKSSFSSSSNTNSNSNYGYYGFGNYSTQNNTPMTGTGTGVIISSDGYIVTNAHVIYDNSYGYGLAKDISILLSDETTQEAKVIGYDVDCDLAVLKIEASDLTAAEFGNSEELQLGESVIAIGNPLGFELMNTVTSGVVSGLNRSISINDKDMNLIQTDAAINSGNSGGPLHDMYGKVIGINSSKMSSNYSETTIEGIGFAIPINQIKPIIEKYGYVTGKPQIGISGQDVTEAISQLYNLPIGVYVTEVNKGGAADNIGICAGDVITEMDGTEVTTITDLNSIKNKHTAGDTVSIKWSHNGEISEGNIVLEEIKQ